MELRAVGRFNNEKGAVSIEFLGILPFFFLFFLLLWQVVGTGYAVFSAKTAVNDAAKVYASTGSYYEASEAAKNSIGNSSVVKYKRIEIPSTASNGKFRIELYSDHIFTFVPDKWKNRASIEFKQEAHGRLLTTP
ncbi:pilus assembly protein [Bacillus sp. PS06]|uniref:pilus assembly protein n=1 Tax=Bacillus sp. PS06 TaxID=2764176 RepID=UPI0017836735|nr:pilus assembly protein [Bacillus sp. PS06]MBD8071136.1 pilus assembly protein [Bacillus sp. PS06]